MILVPVAMGLLVLDQPGTYEIRCWVEGHAEAGMVGRLVVVP